jgi:hypothetical protein
MSTDLEFGAFLVTGDISRIVVNKAKKKKSRLTYTGFAILLPHTGYIARTDLIMLKFQEKVIETEQGKNLGRPRRSQFVPAMGLNEGRAKDKNILKILADDHFVKFLLYFVNQFCRSTKFSRALT